MRKCTGKCREQTTLGTLFPPLLKQENVRLLADNRYLNPGLAVRTRRNKAEPRITVKTAKNFKNIQVSITFAHQALQAAVYSLIDFNSAPLSKLRCSL